MKLNGSVLVVVAMMVGSVGAMGCKSQDGAATSDSAAATPEDNPEAAPVSNDLSASASVGVEKDAVGIHWGGVHAPPAVRIEERGVAPGPNHFWRPGYYGWNGRDYAWHGGRWYPHRAGYEYTGPAWHNIGGRWGYRPGRWYRR